jgi:hypothetical protein
MNRGEDMNKKILAILFVALLFIGGAASLLADESQEPTEQDHELTDLLPPESPPTLSGIGNGGGGNPG